ncbi:MAG: DUF3185 family protein, partial [Cytophagales bacterium]|nr:DUF3185 family protein [Cytophagales bacterium]
MEIRNRKIVSFWLLVFGYGLIVYGYPAHKSFDIL